MPQKSYKQPVSVLVVVYTPDGQILLIERADRPGYWQSVTGSREADEALIDTAHRELYEETGLSGSIVDWSNSNRYEIYEHWRHRYAPGTLFNTEHVFSLCLPRPCPVTLAPGEHVQYVWLNWVEAAQKVFSPSNAEAIRMLADRGEID